MAQLSMNETTTFRWSFEEDVANYAAAGIPAIGVWRQKLSDCGEAKAIELLQEHGLKASHLLWAGGFTGSDGRSYRESVEDAQGALRLAKRLGAPSLVVYSGGRAGHTFNHARRLIRDALVELAATAEEVDVLLAVEPMYPACATHWTFLHTADDVLDLIETVGSPQVKLVFDTYHLGQDEKTLQQIERIAPQVAIVQLGDARQPPADEQNRCPLGEGNLPLREIVRALKAAGYDGYYDVELLGEEIETADYQSLLTHSIEAYNKLLAT